MKISSKFRFQKSDGATYVKFLKQRKMKRIIAISCFILACGAFVSCTNDDEDTTSKDKLTISADAPDETGGGSNGQTPIPPPKP